MTLDLAALQAANTGKELELLRAHINPRFAKVLETIGFDATYVRAQGAHLWDKNGKDYLDMLAGYGVFNIGRNHPKVKAAITQYLALDTANLIKMGTQLWAGLLAKKLTELAPAGLSKVFFCQSGQEACEGALKFARAWTGKTRILYCDRGYHGLSFGMMAVTGDDHFRTGFGPLLPGTTQLPYGDATALEAELRRGDVAAFIVEPVQGHGVFIPPEGYFQKVRELCTKYGAAFVMDEVQMGFGRTGKLFGCHHSGVKPDIMTLSKALSGGYCPIGAILFGDAIYDKVFTSMERSVVHSSTFSQNDLASVCGLAALDVLAEEKIVENAAKQGEYLLAGLKAMVGKFEYLKGVRGQGLVIGIEFGPPRSLTLKAGYSMVKGLNKDLFCQAFLIPLMMDHGILAQVAAHGLDVIKLIPPLVITREDCDRFLKSFEEVLVAAHKFPGPLWEVGSRLAKNAMA
jgi:ornithine--oxo-acid transaminase